jgi:hypothetical protein
VEDKVPLAVKAPVPVEGWAAAKAWGEEWDAEEEKALGEGAVVVEEGETVGCVARSLVWCPPTRNRSIRQSSWNNKVGGSVR